MAEFSIMIHGGAGTILKEDMTFELEDAYYKALQQALNAGFGELKNQGSAVGAVRTAIQIMEDNVLFNAGKGSVFSHKGVQEMDAAIMDGRDLNAGSVTGVRNIRNPIDLAYKIMRNSDHVMLSGKGAGAFAIRQGVKLEPDEYFFSQFRYDQWRSIRDSDRYSLDHTNIHLEELMKDKKFGTVGAVAKDIYGNIAAATSTGGMTNKKYGRIGDSPLIGCGTYADNNTCAISCTGHGEFFIRAVAAHDVSCLMEYSHMSLQEAMDCVVNKKLFQMGGQGGMIGMDKNGHFAYALNCAGMYRGALSSDGGNLLGIYRGEDKIK